MKKHIFLAVLYAISMIGCGGTADNQEQKNNTTTYKDTQKPSISLIGKSTLFLERGELFADPGAKALDNKDGDISSSIVITPATINTNIPGTYEITYTVTDQAGNSSSIKRKIIVLDIIKDPQSHKKTGLVINEVLATNNSILTDPDFKQFSDWIELYNNSSNDLNIGGYYLSDDPTNTTKWKIPSQTTIKAKQYLLIWADKKNKELHTNFSLDSSGETLILSDKNGNKLDSITFDKQKRDISVTTLDNKNYYMYPTPSAPNKNAINALHTSDKPIFNQESGFYTGAQQITISHNNNATIYYTTDGSIPTLNSSIYKSPVSINKTTVIRARALEYGKFLSAPVNKTFLIDEKGKHVNKLPVISISINHEYLFDPQIGIYVIGEDKNGNPNPPKDRKSTNFYQPWLRPAAIEMIKDGKSLFSKNVGLKIHGDGSRTRAQKSFDIYFKEKYGAKSLQLPLFRYKPYIKKVKSFILRKSTLRNPIRDGIAQTIIKDTMNIDYQSYEPTAVFINGTYWGILNIREKQNEDYFATNHNVDRNNLDIGVVTNEKDEYEIKSGTIDDYIALRKYMQTYPNPNSSDYENHLLSQIDMDEYIDYLIAQNYFNSIDWYLRNVKFWRVHKTGKWRWALYDWDSAMGSPQENTFEISMTDIDLPQTPAWSTLFQRKVLANNTFRQKFVSKFCTHLNTTFQSDRMLNILNNLANEVEDDIQYHFEKWPLEQSNSFKNDIEVRKYFLEERSDSIRNYLGTWFGYEGNNIVSIEKPANGNIYIDNIKLNNNFHGSYFNNTKITLKAVPHQGYKFVKWSNNSTQQTIEVPINNNITFNAIFEKSNPPKIVINEINYKSDKQHNTDDWIELVNIDDKPIDLSYWSISDNNISKFEFPQNTVLNPGRYIVVCKNITQFKKFHPDIYAIGNLPFGLNKNADNIYLYDKQGAHIDNVAYDPTWTKNAQNGYNTLALTDPSKDNTLSANWAIETDYGTPGKRN